MSAPCRHIETFKEIPTWKSDSISVDFIMGLFISALKKNIVWAIMNKLTESAHFIPIHVIWGIERQVTLSVKEMVRLHGVLKDIVSYFESLTHRLGLPLGRLVILYKLLYSAYFILCSADPTSPIDFIMLMALR